MKQPIFEENTSSWDNNVACYCLKCLFEMSMHKSCECIICNLNVRDFRCHSFPVILPVQKIRYAACFCKLHFLILFWFIIMIINTLFTSANSFTVHCTLLVIYLQRRMNRKSRILTSVVSIAIRTQPLTSYLFLFDKLLRSRTPRTFICSNSSAGRSAETHGKLCYRTDLIIIRHL